MNFVFFKTMIEDFEAKMFWFFKVIIILVLLGPPTTFAQETLPLNETCTVTIGNQTAIVRPDGTFFVRNISVFQSRDTGIAPQLYRVRATCLRGGLMETGQSEFFPLTPGQTRFIADVLPSNLDPIPTKIEIFSPADFLPVGNSVQLTVTATLPDGSTEDVTSRSAGTTYLSTNSALLTVTEEGVVTGTNNSSFLQSGGIAVLNEGNLATINFRSVGPSNDFDNDGMPNDFEDLFGLDKFTNDANNDLDNDGLTNIQEFTLGTIVNNPDTDGDGVPDGLDGDPLRPEESPPIVTIDDPNIGDELVQGETILFQVEASDDGLLSSVEFFVNGESFGTVPSAPFEVFFTAPVAPGNDSLVFGAQATDGSGNIGIADEVSVSVIPDPFTTVQGIVVDESQTPVEGATVELKVDRGGVKGEFFDFDVPLSEIPDLSGLTPDLVKRFYSLNFRNPNGIFGPDTFGVNMAPDFAARFTAQGFTDQSEAGETTTFILGADDAARLKIKGTVVAEVSPTGNFVEDQGTFTFQPGLSFAEIEYFQAVGNAELELSVIFEGETERQQIDPQDIIPPADLFSSFTTTTGPDGSFSLTNVPTIIKEFRVTAHTMVGDEDFQGSSLSVAPVPGDVTDVGDITIRQRGTIFGSSSVQGTNPGSIFQIDTETGVATLIGTPENTGNGLSDITFDPVSGILFAMHGAATRGAELLTLDTNSGAVLSRAILNNPFNALLGSDALAFDSFGTLFAGGWNNGRLLTLNPATAEVLSDLNVTGGTDRNHLSDLAIDPTTGLLWASRGNNSPGLIMVVDPSNGVATFLLNLNIIAPITAITFDADGTLYGSLQGNQLVRIDKVTGVVTSIGTGFGGPKISGLGTRP